MKKGHREIICREVFHIRTQTAFRGVKCSLRALNRIVVDYFVPSMSESRLMVEHSMGLSIICDKINIKKASYLYESFVYI